MGLLTNEFSSIWSRLDFIRSASIWKIIVRSCRQWMTFEPQRVGGEDWINTKIS